MRRLILPIIFAAACGDYVRYDGDAPGGGGIGRGSLDEETREKLARADHLDHLLLRAILAEHAVKSDDGDHVYFDYDALAASDEGLLLLDQYLATLDLVSPDQLRDEAERLAYWINGYNAAVIRGVVTEYAGDHSYSVSRGGFIFFDTPAYSFGGAAFSLNQIEHAIVRGDEDHAAFERSSPEQQTRLRELHRALFGGGPADARIHVAFNCASRSCPNLLGDDPHIFRAETLDEQLDRASRAFAQNAVKGAGGDGISQLFDWYAKDFEAVYGNAAGFIAMHREGGLTGVNLDRYITYDWSLNIRP
jgi:hypothetical protein